MERDQIIITLMLQTAPIHYMLTLPIVPNLLLVKMEKEVKEVKVAKVGKVGKETSAQTALKMMNN